VSARPGWIAAVAVAVVLGWITWNTIHTEGQGGRGLPAGAALPPFAAPLAQSRLEGDANVFTRASDGHRAACDVRGPDVLNSCDLAARGPVVLGFFSTHSARCETQMDVLDRLRRRFTDVAFAAVAIRGDHDDARAVTRERRWQMPVAWDRDGAVANAYAVSVCPTMTLARRGGRVAQTLVGVRDAATLARCVQVLRAGVGRERC
jgi:peroxiredoxin